MAYRHICVCSIHHPIRTWCVYSYFNSACMLLFLILPFLIWVTKTSSLSQGQFLNLVPKGSLLLLLGSFFVGDLSILCRKGNYLQVLLVLVLQQCGTAARRTALQSPLLCCNAYLIPVCLKETKTERSFFRARNPTIKYNTSK